MEKIRHPEAGNAELAENGQRKDFTPSEMVAVVRAVEALEKKEARERQGAHTDKHPGNLPESRKGDSRDKAAGSVVQIGGRRQAKGTSAAVSGCQYCIPYLRSSFSRSTEGGEVKLAFLDLMANSIPARVTTAWSNRLNPSIGRTRCLIRRWSCSTRLLVLQ